MEFRPNDNIGDILAREGINKPVDILLESGHSYSGTIQKVGQMCIVLKLTGNRSFYDAIIRIEDISALEFKVRS